MSIAIVYDRSETDELGIKLTAKELGIDLAYIPFHKVSFRIDNDGYHFRSKGKDYFKIVEDSSVILNRMQSKNRRLFAAYIFEALNKYVINPSPVEFVCFSKMRTSLNFWRENVGIPTTIYVPSNPIERRTNGGAICNQEDIADLVQQELNNGNVVIKPDAGTHGKEVKLARNRGELLKILKKTETSIINPCGVLAQEFVEKWFYDLRIVVAKKIGETPYCYPKALARAGFEDFRTNTYLGNMVFGVNLPRYIRKTAVKCGEAVGKKCEAWVLAFDAMLDIGEDKTVDDKYIKRELEKLVPSFNEIRKVKIEKNKKKKFSSWNKRLEKAFQNYMSSEAYENVKNVIEENVENKMDRVLFHEANCCPEFWEQTRLIAGANLAIPLLECAQSVIDSDREKNFLQNLGE